MRGCRATPLEPYMCGFRDHLSRQGYSENRLALHLRHMAHLGRWLDEHGVDLGHFNLSHVEAFLVDRRAAYPYLSGLCLRGLAPLVWYLRRIDVLAQSSPSPPATPVELLLNEFVDYLRQERGLAEETIAHYQYTASRFLWEHASRLDLTTTGVGSLGSQEVTAFVLSEADRLNVGSLRQSVAALRALLRFLHAEGHVSTSLVAAAPAAAGWHGGELPPALEPHQVEQLLASCDRNTASGLRDYAMLTLLWRLGLRAGEVAACRVGDVDWRNGEILIHGKGNRHEMLPLPVDVGRALVEYCCRGRPHSRCQALFLQKTAPHGLLTRNAVSQVVRQACQRAGLPAVGAHRLRHTAATEMLRAGSSLAAIGQVLRHRDVATTAIYAKVDRSALRALARPWPGTVA
jgi:integrase/recombinase XerD